MMKKYLFPLLFSGFILSACTSTKFGQPAQPSDWQAQRDWQNFEASGRLGVKVQEKGSYANFDWYKQNGVETIDINTPLGTTVGQLCQDSEGVLALDNKGNLYQADTAEALSEQLLGYPIPIQHLGVWANGEWVSDQPHEILADGKLKQLGWVISRELDEENLPSILLLENNQLSVRLAFTEVSRTEGKPEKLERCEARSNP